MGQVQELGIVGVLGGGLVHGRDACVSVDELKDEWAAGDDAIAAGQKVLLHNGLEHGGLAGGLGAYDDNLRQVDGVAADGVEDILQFVDEGNQVIHWLSCVVVMEE